MRKLKFVSLLVLLALLLSVMPGAVVAQEPPPGSSEDAGERENISAQQVFSVRANIGFGATVSDDEILRLLQQYEVVPNAVYMWTSGLTGTCRFYDNKDVQTFLRDARAKAAETLEKSLQGNQLRLQRFVARHTEGEIAVDAELQTEARSLLNIRATLKTGLAAVKNGQPLIFSMEMSGDADQIERLRNDEAIKVFERVGEMDGKIEAPHTPKPEAYQEEYFAPDVQAMSPQELYRQIRSLSDRAEIPPTPKPQDKTEHESFQTYVPASFSPLIWYWYPTEGNLYYNGSYYADSYLRWGAPGGWSVSDPGYEHDFSARSHYFTSCTSWTNLPYGYDDCPTAGVSEPSNLWTFSFGSFHVTHIHSGAWYYGAWNLGGGGSSSSDYQLAAQENYRGFCWWDSIWYMKSIRNHTLLSGWLHRGYSLYRSW